MIKSMVYAIATVAGVPRTYQRIFAKDSIAVLMYHAVIKKALPISDWCFLEERRFADQIAYLVKHCRIVPLREIPSLINSKDVRPVVAVTFDDGFQNNYDVAFPILKKWRIPATIFLATDFVGSDDTVWFCRIHEALCKTLLSGFEWEGLKFDLSSPSSRAHASSALQAWLKGHSHPQLLEKMRSLIRALGHDPQKPVAIGSPYRMLGPAEIREMGGSGLIDFGAHTCSHAILSGLSNPEREREIAGSIDAIQRLTGAPCTLFAYPNGRPQDYGPCDINTLNERKVEVAVTTIEGPNVQAVPALEMRRYGIGADTSIALFQLLTHHVIWALRKRHADSRY